MEDKIDIDLVKKINERGAKEYPYYHCVVHRSPYGLLYQKEWSNFRFYTINELENLMNTEWYKTQSSELKKFIRDVCLEKIKIKNPELFF